MRILFGIPVLAIAAFFFTSPLPEAPVGFGNKIQALYFNEVL